MKANISKNRISVLVGSIRKDSRSLKMANFLKRISRENMELSIVSIGNLPMYNEDLETNDPPVEWGRFRNEVRGSGGLLFITPEYNRSVPAVLKNAIDVGSAPHGFNVYSGKPAAIVSLSPGMMGAFGANHHLRQSLVFLNVPTMQQPEAYIGRSDTLFNDQDEIIDDGVKTYLSDFMDAFSRWVDIHCS